MNKAQTISFLKKHWFWIVLVLTLLSVSHTYWFYFIHKTDADLRKIFKGVEEFQLKSKNIYYSTGLGVGALIGNIIKSKTLLFSVLGLGVVLSHLNYKYLFMPIFIEEGRVGKFLYLLVFTSLYFVLFWGFNSALSGVLVEKNFDNRFTNFYAAFILIYAFISYGNMSYKKIKDLSLEKTKAELVALKAQINPHFLFNVLNNLYGQAIMEDSPKTADGIQKLSSIMRHVVEETKTERSPIHKEIVFLEDYIELQKIRIPERENIKLKFEIEWDETPVEIAPLLLIPFVENAFKYGISTSKESFIDFKVKVKNKTLSMICRNSIAKKSETLEIGTGTGLENTKKRLELYYHAKHTLNLSQTEDIFDVKLDIQL